MGPVAGARRAVRRTYLGGSDRVSRSVRARASAVARRGSLVARGCARVLAAFFAEVHPPPAGSLLAQRAGCRAGAFGDDGCRALARGGTDRRTPLSQDFSALDANALADPPGVASFGRRELDGALAALPLGEAAACLLL